jgi:hypothetical protein
MPSKTCSAVRNSPDLVAAAADSVSASGEEAGSEDRLHPSDAAVSNSAMRTKHPTGR